MGIKLLSLQMIPMCFHVMGNAAYQPSDEHPPTPHATKSGRGGGRRKAGPRCVKLIRVDGKVEVYHRPVSASELMNEHPKHLVCRSDAFTIGQLIPALPAGEQLQPGHAYFLLPVHFFQSVLSFVTLASSFSTAAAAAVAGAAKGGHSLLQRPFEVHKTPSGKLQIRISDEFIQRMQEAQERGNGRGSEEGSGGGRVCTTAALEKDYQQLVVGCRERQWKPKLESIKELEKRKGRLVAAGGVALRSIRRRRKKGSHQVDPHAHDQIKQQLQQKKEKPKKAHQAEPHGHDQIKQQLQQKQQQKQQKKQQKKEKPKKAHQTEPHDHDQKQPQPQKKQKQKVSAIAKHQSSPSSNKRQEKKVLASHLER